MSRVGHEWSAAVAEDGLPAAVSAIANSEFDEDAPLIDARFDAAVETRVPYTHIHLY